MMMHKGPLQKIAVNRISVEYIVLKRSSSGVPTVVSVFDLNALMFILGIVLKA